MRKHEELTNPRSTLAQASPDELIFVLTASDPVAAAAIRSWAYMRVRYGHNCPQDQTIIDAHRLADKMEEEYQ